jgi:hypothetical protein
MRHRDDTESFDDCELVTCVKPFVAEHGRLVARLGEEMRSDDPRVRLFPEAFVPIGTPRSQWSEARIADLSD